MEKGFIYKVQGRKRGKQRRGVSARIQVVMVCCELGTAGGVGFLESIWTGAAASG